MQFSRIWIRATILAGIASGCALAMCAAEKAEGIRVIWAYNGDWKAESDTFDTAQSKAGHEKAALHNACWMDGDYLACNQYVDGDSKVLLIFTYSAKDKTYTTYQVPRDGGKPGNGKLEVEGNVWTFPWQTSEGDVTTYFRVVNTFTTPDHIEYRKEFSTDKTHWTLMAKGTTIRVSSK
jgi:hypothetical protein